MGNSNSQHHQIPGHHWTHSYPRPRHVQSHVKVLPERVSPLRLRTTDNGAILQNGGTISCRKEERTHRPRSSSAHRPPKLEGINLDKTRFGSEPDLRFHLKDSKDQFNENAIRQRISRSRKKYKAPPAPHNGLSSGMESSSPDLNLWESNSKDCNTGPGRKARLFKTRAETSKKAVLTVQKSEADSEISMSTDTFSNMVRSKFRDEKLEQSTKVEKERIEKKELKRSVSQEVISTNKSLATPEFQAELLQAAQRLRSSSGISRHSQASGKLGNGKPHEGRVKENTSLTRIIDTPKDINFNSSNKIAQEHQPTDTPSKFNKEENVNAGKAQNLFNETGKTKTERDVPSKKFYFGMKENSNEIRTVSNCESANNVNKTNAEHRITAVEKSKNLMNLYKSVADGTPDWEDTVDKFASNFHKSQLAMTNGNTTSCSSSFVSDPDEDVVGGIALQLRPTLPKKQLEIPRFSPTTAWRLLSSIDAHCPQSSSPGGSDEGPLLLEDQIHIPRSQQGLRSTCDKSGDSGISGDASPGGCPESSSEIAVTTAKSVATQKNILVAWTPQQDLEEESSSDDLEPPLNSSKNIVSKIPGAKFSPRGQLFLSRDQSFSLSVSREEPMCLYLENTESKDWSNSDSKLNNLKSLKTALGASRRSDGLDESTLSQNDNWVLSRSVPSSLNNSHVATARTMSNPSSPDQDNEFTRQASLKYPSYSYLTNGGRMMYLPEYHSRMSPDVLEKRPRDSMGSAFLSKSCENVIEAEMRQVARSRTPSPIVGRSRRESKFSPDMLRATPKKKKFTFQSTVRLIENRRIAEKLSREAELKENQRLCEVEAMRKVEEEFQRKRAREKANIRHQLRLFSLEEKNFSSLPPNDWDENTGDVDGAPSSLPPASNLSPQRKFSSSKKIPAPVDSNKFAATTQVLSEYRESVRNYRDYRHSRCPEPQELITETNKKSIVEHPRMVYDMPKNTAVYVTAPVNSFAQNQYKEENRIGMLTPRSASSDNYRKDFAHGAVAAAGRSLTSSDSELSQTHTRSTSRQGVTSRRFLAAHRSRSTSSESLSPTASPHRSKESSVSPTRSRSVSPVRILVTQKCRSVSPEKISSVKICDSGNKETSGCRNKFGNSLERKLSNPSDYHTSLNDRQGTIMDGKTGKQDALVKSTTNSLLRLGLPSLQPFEKTEKSFRPINFNPVINKLAQTVS